MIHGECAPEFAGVREALRENFASRGEIGATVCVYQGGRKVVDLWGGHLDRERTRPWHEDTLCIMFSVAKSMCALCVHVLADRGLVELDAPVARYWPEFAQGGKEGVLLRHVLAHQCGVCFNDHARPGDIYDWPAMIAALEAQEPAWPPGTRGAYNTVNIGYILGEVVRRVSGKPVNEFLRDEICRPLGADYAIGLDDGQLARVTDLHANPENAMFRQGAAPGTPLARAWNALPKPLSAAMYNALAFRQGLVASFGGHGTARGMARIYAMLAGGGAVDGVRLLREESVARLRQMQWQAPADGMLGRPFSMALGFFTNHGSFFPMGPNPNAFGHLGSGGALAFADPDRNLAFAACTNFQAEGASIGQRTAALVEAVMPAMPR